MAVFLGAFNGVSELVFSDGPGRILLLSGLAYLTLALHHLLDPRAGFWRARQSHPIRHWLAYGLVMTFIILKVIDLVIGLRVSEEEEREGLDVALHGEHVE